MNSSSSCISNIKGNQVKGERSSEKRLKNKENMMNFEILCHFKIIYRNIKIIILKWYNTT